MMGRPVRAFTPLQILSIRYADARRQPRLFLIVKAVMGIED